MFVWLIRGRNRKQTSIPSRLEANKKNKKKLKTIILTSIMCLRLFGGKNRKTTKQTSYYLSLIMCLQLFRANIETSKQKIT
jgi:hypothetical protein